MTCYQVTTLDAGDAGRAGVRADVGLESGVRSAAVAAKRHRGAGRPRPYICMPQRPLPPPPVSCLHVSSNWSRIRRSRVEWRGEGRGGRCSAE